jgi:putative colanic acid biosynthesis acetyltransferase WcaF
LFGAKIYGTPFVHQRARIAIPWNLTLHDRACLGDRANAYTLGEIEIGPRVRAAQEVYLSTGTHDLRDRKFHSSRQRSPSAKTPSSVRALLSCRA